MKIVAIVLSLFLVLTLFNTAYAQLTTVGREFYVGFMENNKILPNRPDQASIIISANEDATGTINYSDNTINFSINAGEQFVHEFPQSGIDIIHRTSGTIENKGIYITSSGNLTVHAFNFRERSADGTIILPLTSLGKDYRVTAHHEKFTEGVEGGSNVNYESTLLVIAVEDDTDIEITTAAPTVNTIPANAPINVTLNRGESYQIKANGDLTGSRVRVLGSDEGDCKNVAVFGGNKMTSVGLDCDGTTGDHLFQQTYPTFTWGKDYTHIPLKGRTSGEIVKVLAAEDNTQVFVNGQQAGNLKAGKFLTLTFARDEFANISSSKPTSVTVFSKSQGCNVQNGPLASNGDPTMITYSPNQQLVKSVTFSAVVVVGIVNHYVNIITKTTDAGKTILDGLNIGNQFQAIPGNPDFSYAQVEVSVGSHTLINSEGFIGYVYGSGFIESYGYAVGAGLNNLNFETEVLYDFEVEGDKVACLNQEGSWTVIPQNPKFEIFEWTFGDNTSMKEGQTVEHLFESPGIYQVKIIAMTGDRSCDQIEEAFFEVEVLETQGELDGPTKVCPLIDEGTYSFVNTLNTERVVWEVVGGKIVEENDFTAVIKWGEFDPEAKVIATPVTAAGCLGESVILPILINDAIAPAEAEGLGKICYQENTNYSYQVSNIIPGRSYQWFVEGGTIVSGGQEAKVSVDWGNPGSQGIIWYEEFSITNPSCAGESLKLTIEVNEPLETTISEITEFICIGSSEGRIELQTRGGSGNYAFEWSHDAELNQPSAENLGAGLYSVTVMDGGGCKLFFDNLEIKESSAMEISGSLIKEDASCFDKADGSVIFSIQGGTAPYSINTLDALILGSEIQMFNLGRGEYTFQVTDQSNCEIPVSFSIDSPVALTAEFQIENHACPGLANGALLAIPEGGVLPYSLTWHFDEVPGVRLKDIPKGEYGLLITDANGCEQVVIASMEEANPQVRVPTGFKPADGLFEAVRNCQIEYRMMIFNKWGELIYVGNSGWDGKIRGNEAPLGTYTYMVEYDFNLEGRSSKKQQRGIFTLIR